MRFEIIGGPSPPPVPGRIRPAALDRLLASRQSPHAAGSRRSTPGACARPPSERGSTSRGWWMAARATGATASSPSPLHRAQTTRAARSIRLSCPCFPPPSWKVSLRRLSASRGRRAGPGLLPPRPCPWLSGRVKRPHPQEACNTRSIALLSRLGTSPPCGVTQLAGMLPHLHSDGQATHTRWIREAPRSRRLYAFALWRGPRAAASLGGQILPRSWRTNR